MSRPLKVFLCHSSGDKPPVRELYRALAAQGIDVWLDEEKLLPGQDWQLEIAAAVQDADAVIVCLSPSSITKEGFVQKELKFAIEKAEEKPEGTIFIIPVRLLQCEVPKRLQHLQWVDMFNQAGFNLNGVGYKKLIGALRIRAVSKGLNPPIAGELPAGPNLQIWADIKFVHIPAGEFIMGSRDDDPLASGTEKPQHRLELPYDFYIGRFPVTNAQYNQFLLATQPPTPEPNEWQRKPDHPAANISWHSAWNFCEWLNQTTGEKLPKNMQFRLPTEAEWEKAARGEHGNEWPWGNEWDSSLCNTEESSEGKVTRVGIYSPRGDSSFGAADMAGNVWEWTLDLWGTDIDRPESVYPYIPPNVKQVMKAGNEVCRVLRGGSVQDSSLFARCASRRGGFPLMSWPSSGFRAAVCPVISTMAGQ